MASTQSEDSLPTSPSLLHSLTIPGNEAAWTTFVERYSPLILEQCRKARLQSADAEEIRSRVLAKLVRALARLTYDPSRSFRGYLRSVVRNAVASYWRERNRPGAVGSGEFRDDQPGDSPLPEVMLELGEMLEDRVSARLLLVERVIERIRVMVREDTWRAYWMTAVEGRPAPEVARELGKSVGAVYMAKHRVASLLMAQGEFEAHLSGETN